MVDHMTAPAKIIETTDKRTHSAWTHDDAARYDPRPCACSRLLPHKITKRRPFVPAAR